MEKTNERKLIKFSNYSLCVTLPKSVIKRLNWEKGDIVFLDIDEKKAEIIIKKKSKNKQKNNSGEIKNTTDSKSRW